MPASADDKQAGLPAKLPVKTVEAKAYLIWLVLEPGLVAAADDKLVELISAWPPYEQAQAMAAPVLHDAVRKMSGRQ